MERCQDLFNKIIKELDNYSSFEMYYEALKRNNYSYLFCNYYLKDKVTEYSYSAFFEKVETLTAFFEKELSEFPENSWVGIKLSNHPYYLAAFFALLKNNFNVILLDNNGSDDYFNYVIENTKLVAIITDEPFGSNMIKFIRFQDAISSKLKLTTKSRNFSNKIALCTSGTTGYFNVIVYNGAQIMYQIRSVLSIIKKSPIKDMDIDNKTKFLVFPPLHHIFGIIMLLTYSSIGVTNVMCENYALSSFINATKNGNVEWVATVPLIFEALIRFIKGKSSEKEFTSLKSILGENLKFCICGGAYTSPEIIKEFNKSQIIFSECYGMTEAGMITMNIGTQQERENGSVGKINEASCEMKVLKSNNEISTEGVGELIITGPGLYKATLKNGVEIPRKSDVNGGFIKTGDLVEIKSENIYFRDRIKDVIINSSGENVSPRELEKNFDFLLDYKVSFTILGLNDFPVLVISFDNFELQGSIKEELIEKIAKINQKLPLNKKIVSIYFSAKPFPTTSALKIKKYELKNLIKLYPENYVEVKLINILKNSMSLENIIIDLKKFFSTYLNIRNKELKNETLIIEDLNIDSLIMAELIIYVEEKYKVNIEEDFIKTESITIADIANMIFVRL